MTTLLFTSFVDKYADPSENMTEKFEISKNCNKSHCFSLCLYTKVKENARGFPSFFQILNRANNDQTVWVLRHTLWLDFWKCKTGV